MSTIPTSLPGQKALLEHDPELHDLIEKEKHRQWAGLELIASENLVTLIISSIITQPDGTRLRVLSWNALAQL